jgi:SAM-dependent methyltransferase
MIVPIPPARSAIDSQARQNLRGFYGALAPSRAAFRGRTGYYHDRVLSYLRFLIPPGKSLLEVGCGDGWLLRQLQPARGLGIDLSPHMIATARAAAGEMPSLKFVTADIEDVAFDETFDYILLSDLLGSLWDIQSALANIRCACGPGTRVVVSYHNPLWQPLLRASARLGLTSPQPTQTRLTAAEIENFARLCDFEAVSRRSCFLLPVFVPLLSWLANDCLAAVPPLDRLCLSSFLILRPRPLPVPRPASVSVIIPCRNERGNIEAAVQRLPKFGSAQEIIFVNSHSTDGTAEEVQRVQAAYPGIDIKLLHQEDHQGKRGAVRLGFARASHEVLIILDGDLTVAPEDMPKFFKALTTAKGELINGARMIYPMEKEAMRPLNVMGNRLFTAALSRLLGQRVTDTLCGTKVLWKSDYLEIAADSGYLGDLDPFGDFDLLLGAAKLNLKIVDLPVRYLARTYGATKIRRFRQGWMLMRITWLAYWRSGH